jgi:hypothetical protein
MDVQHFEAGKPITAGAFPIWRRRAPLSNSLAERSAKQLGGNSIGKGRHKWRPCQIERMMADSKPNALHRKVMTPAIGYCHVPKAKVLLLEIIDSPRSRSRPHLQPIHKRWRRSAGFAWRGTPGVHFWQFRWPRNQCFHYWAAMTRQRRFYHRGLVGRCVEISSRYFHKSLPPCCW